MHCRYDLYLTCKDFGEPMLENIIKLTIVIVDINDNSPIFSRAFYHLKVFENAPPATLVGTVSATDTDEDDNGRISYYFATFHGTTPHTSYYGSRGVQDSGKAASSSSSSPSSSSSSLSKSVSSNISHFTINARTGQVTSTEILDRERESSHRLMVVAVDHGESKRLSGSAIVEIMVLDENDEVPIFSQEFYHFAISELAKPGTIVGAVSANDADASPNNVFYYRINQQQDFHTNETTALYHHSKIFHKRRHLRADGELTKHFTNVTRNIHSLPSLITKRLKAASLQEVASSPTPFTLRQEKDKLTQYGFSKRMNKHSLLLKDKSFRTLPDDANPLHDVFSINPATGDIVLNVLVDREEHEFHKFVVEAIEGSLERAEFTEDLNISPASSALVTVQILDVNDCPPVFIYPQADSNFTVYNKAVVGQTVGWVLADDDDVEAQNSNVSYSLVACVQCTGDPTFQVDEWTGRIVLVKVLSTEEHDKVGAADRLNLHSTPCNDERAQEICAIVNEH